MAVLSALAIVVAACSSDGGSTVAAGDETSERASSELPAVEFELADGEVTTLDGVIDDRPLVLNFFASWCPPCRAEMPEFQTVYADLRGQVDFLGVDIQDTRAAAEDIIEETGVEYPWAFDPDGRVYVALEGFSMPTTVFISADGEILGRVNGAVSESQLRSRIEELFGVAA